LRPSDSAFSENFASTEIANEFKAGFYKLAGFLFSMCNSSNKSFSLKSTSCEGFKALLPKKLDAFNQYPGF